MLNAFVVRCWGSIGILLMAASTLCGQSGPVVPDTEWARAMVDKDMLNINYKSVAKGQDVFFQIRVTNIYKEEMQITGLATSCGCISWDENKVQRPDGVMVLPAPIVIPSGQERFVTLRLDTIRHHGEQKNKRGTITFFEPSNGQIGTATILAEGYIRTDVVLQPGQMSLHHVLLFHGSEPNTTDHRRIGFAIRYIPTHVRQLSPIRDSATLVRGVDTFNYFDHEPIPTADLHPDAVAKHKEVVDRQLKILYTGAKQAGRLGSTVGL